MSSSSSSTSSTLRTLTSSLPLPDSTKQPLLFDTLILLLIQIGYYLLSRRFLHSALPTLRQISKSPDSIGDDVEIPGLSLGLTNGGIIAGSSPNGGGGGGNPANGGGGGSQNGDDQSREGSPSRRIVNASGGTSEPTSPIYTRPRQLQAEVERGRIGGGGSSNNSGGNGGTSIATEGLGLTVPTSSSSTITRSSNHLSNLESQGQGQDYDSDESDSSRYFNYSGSPAPSTPSEEIAMPLLPMSHSHSLSLSNSHNHTLSAASVEGFGKRLGEVASGQSSSSGNGNGLGGGLAGNGGSTVNKSGLGNGKRRILRVFNGRGGGGGGNSRAKSHDKASGGRVTTSRGLGFLARNLFSLCFSESLLLLTLVMFHSVGILHSRSRHIHFSFGLHLLLLLILFVVPLVQCMQLTYRSRDSHSNSFTPTTTRRTHGSTSTSSNSLPISKRLLISLIPFSLYIFAFTRIPPYIMTTSPVTTPELVFSNSTNLSSSLTGIPLTYETGKLKHGLPKAVHLGDPSELEDDGQPELASLGIGEESYLTSNGSNDQERFMEEDPFAPESWKTGGWMEPFLGRVVVCGVIILGSLSGLGAVRSAWMFYENSSLFSGTGVKGGLGWKGGVITREDILVVERSLYRIRHELVGKREELSGRGGGEIGDDIGGGGGGRRRDYNPTWVGRVFGSAFGGDRESAMLRRELETLESMEMQTMRTLEAMKLRKKRQKFAQTFRGKISNIIGFIFAAYCVARVLMCLTSVFFPPLATNRATPDHDKKGNTNGDWISWIIALGLSQLPNGVVDVNVGSRAISLLLTGLLILSSLAQVLRSVSKILRLTSKSIGAGFLLLGLGQLMSTYVISLLIQLRGNLPPPYPELDGFANPTLPATPQDPSLLATLPDFRVFGRLFDITFLLAATGTALIRYISSKL